MFDVVLIFFAGGTVSEEKQKDAGHFDSLHHSHCSNNYSFWNKVFIMHSPDFGVMCGCLLCICVDFSVSVSQFKFDCFSQPPGNVWKNSTFPCRCTSVCVEKICGWFLMKETISLNGGYFIKWLTNQQDSVTKVFRTWPCWHVCVLTRKKITLWHKQKNQYHC